MLCKKEASKKSKLKQFFHLVTQLLNQTVNAPQFCFLPSPNSLITQVKGWRTHRPEVRTERLCTSQVQYRLGSMNPLLPPNSKANLHQLLPKTFGQLLLRLLSRTRPFLLKTGIQSILFSNPHVIYHLQLNSNKNNQRLDIECIPNLIQEYCPFPTSMEPRHSSKSPLSLLK